MATVYARSTDGNDADDGSTWALADATLAASLTAAGAGGRSYVSDNHAETQASAMTLTSPGTAASPTEVVCGDDAAEPPTAVATTGTVSTTGANNITFAGFAYVYGVTFQAGSGSSLANLSFTSGSPWVWTLDNCTLKLNHTNASGQIVAGATAGTGDDQLLKLLNTTLTFGAVGQMVLLRAPLRWFGGSVAGTAPTTLLVTAAACHADARIAGVDLSLITGNLVSVAAATTGLVEFIDCKLAAGVLVVTGTRPGPGGVVVRLVNCDSGPTNYRYYLDAYEGTITHETTIVRTGGASDGTTPISRKMVTTANAKFHSPLVTDWFGETWNETTGSALTATCEIVNDGSTFTDADVWLEVEYLGTSGFPLGVFVSDRAANILTTPANQTTSSVTWTTTGLTSPVKQKLAVTFTPQEKGVVRARVCCAKASTTLYHDFKFSLAA